MTDADIDAAKATARTRAFAARKSAHQSGVAQKANATLTEYILAQPAQIIAAYMAIRTEIDPLETMTALHEAGRAICIPVIKGAGQPLSFQRWSPGCELIDGPFGAKIPANPEPLIPDLVITPLVAFDPQFTRLGYGGGFYDRSLSEIRQIKPAPALGFAYAAQELTELPRGPYDIPLDAIFTENAPRFPA